MFVFLRKIICRINKKDEESPEYRLKFVKRIRDKKIRYVSERVTDKETGEIIDTIIGRDGFFNINKNGELSIYLNSDSGGKELFRAFVPNLKAYEFLSLEGVVLQSVDLLTNKERQIIAYYKYYR